MKEGFVAEGVLVKTGCTGASPKGHRRSLPLLKVAEDKQQPCRVHSQKVGGDFSQPLKGPSGPCGSMLMKADQNILLQEQQKHRWENGKKAELLKNQAVSHMQCQPGHQAAQA